MIDYAYCDANQIEQRVQALTNRHLILAANGGSYFLPTDLGSFEWVVATTKEITLVRAHGPVNSDKEQGQSTRSELLEYIQVLSEWREIHFQGHLDMHIDSE